MCVPYPEYGCLGYDAAVTSAINYLQVHMPPFDQRDTLFGVAGGVDGLNIGVASVGVNMSIDAKQKYLWARPVTQEIYEEYVSSYAFINEPRTNWRQLIGGVPDSIVREEEDAWSAANSLNREMWTQLNNITFVSGKTPLVYDPVSTVAFGYASCTGVSATFAAALRAVGIPARVAGTPAWRGIAENGNHNWVEIYDEGTWYFVEGRPASGKMTMSKDPCSNWFCTASRFRGQTEVYAARFDTLKNDSYFVMAWDLHNLNVPADNRTAYYNDVCSNC